jgi:hydrogenase expression/formation protein HypC
MCLAVPGKLVSIEGDDPLLRTGRVDFGGIVKTVNLACVPDALVGEYVLVHVGIALNTIDEQEAAEVFEYLRRMGELAELEAGESGQLDAAAGTAGDPACETNTAESGEPG